MTTIKTTCHWCGDVELGLEELALELNPSQDAGTYRFICPVCSSLQRRPANARVVSVLLATGVAFEVVTTTPITEDEIEAFAQAMQSEEDILRLLTA